MITTEITRIPATELAQRIRLGQLSSLEVVEAHIERIQELNDRLNALVIPRFDDARHEAEAADAVIRHGEEVGPLHGVPVTIKDQFDVAGLPTTFGVARLQHHRATSDGPMVASWRNAGAIILGKTNVPQTLYSNETDNAVFGRTNNPWDVTRTPGGSSGGETALIAAGGSPLGLGGDLGGSLRVPAGWCGLTTIRPTARRLPIDRPPIRTASGFEGLSAQPGPIARNAADVVLALRIMIEHNMANPNGLFPPVSFREPATVEISRLRIAVLPSIGGWTPSPAVSRGLELATSVFKAQGAIVEEWRDSPDTQAGVNRFISILVADGFSFVRQILEYEKPVPLIKPNVRLTSIPAIAKPIVAALLRVTGQQRLLGMFHHVGRHSAADLMDLFGERLAYEEAFVAALDAGRYDAILCPSTPIVAPPHGTTNDLADFWGSTLLFSALGMPAGVTPVTRVLPEEDCSGPASKDKALQAARAVDKGSVGMPVAVQIAARHWREDIVLALIQALESGCRRNADYPHTPV